MNSLPVTASAHLRSAPVRVLNAAVHAMFSFLAGIVTFSVIVTLLALSAGLLPAFLLGIPVFWLTLHVSDLFARMERGRAAAVLGVRVAVPPRPQAETWPARIWARFKAGATWRALAYQLLLLPVGVLGYIVVVVTWAIGLSLTALPAYAWTIPSDGRWLAAGTWWQIAAWTALGLAALVIAPALTLAVGALNATMVRGLLGRTEREMLSERVETLSRTRSAAVDAADAERRRIERDLHDGAQPRLVALAMNLGMAKEKLDTDPAAAKELIDTAHEEAKQAITELRTLARGIHPAVLVDRGLDAALSALAARSPIPVELSVDVGERCPPAIEAVAYFVVGEALTNAAKHSGARSIRVTVRRAGGTLTVAVFDDGRGGATLTGGTGLAGLAGRVHAVDGTFTLTSPAGGPTLLAVELPCVS